MSGIAVEGDVDGKYEIQDEDWHQDEVKGWVEAHVIREALGLGHRQSLA